MTHQHQHTQYRNIDGQNPHQQTHQFLTYIYIPQRDAASPHYATLDTDITNCIQHITNTQDSIFTGDADAHSTLLLLIHTLLIT